MDESEARQRPRFVRYQPDHSFRHAHRRPADACGDFRQPCEVLSRPQPVGLRRRACVGIERTADAGALPTHPFQLTTGRYRENLATIDRVRVSTGREERQPVDHLADFRRTTARSFVNSSCACWPPWTAPRSVFDIIERLSIWPALAASSASAICASWGVMLTSHSRTKLALPVPA